jgi:DNA-binding XRE family transcriptional regulator
LREKVGKTQTEVAAALGVSRPNVARIEKEDDIRRSTLDRDVAALNGRVKIVAVFDDHEEDLLS